MAEFICPYCRKPIYDEDALLCLYCGESLKRPVGFMGKLKYPKPKAIIIAIVALVLISFIILMLR